MENLTVVATIFLTFHCRQSIRCFNSFVKRKISPLFEEFFGLRLQAIYPLFQFFSHMGNLTVVSQINWPLIAGNLSVVSILLSNVKSHRYFNAFLALYCRQSIHRFSFLSQMENQTVVLTIFYLRLQAMYPLFQFFSQMGNRIVVLTIFWPCIVSNLSVVSNPF